jgi:hypothetical protein
MSFESLHDREIEDAEKDLLLKVGVYETVHPGDPRPAAIRKAIKECDLGLLGEIAYTGVPFGQELFDYIQAVNYNPLNT